MPSKDTQFTSDNQPPTEKKSRKGIPNAKTIIENLSKSEDVTDSDGKKVTRYVKMMDNLLRKAEEGDLGAIKEVLNRCEGMAKQHIEASIPNPMNIYRAKPRKKKKGKK